MVMVAIGLLLFFIVLLVKSSDFFVEAVARMAKYFGVSEFVIGLTIVAIGTSLPELGSSVVAAYMGANEFAIGNILGSNIANIGLILGFSAIFVSIRTNEQIFNRDALIMLLVLLLTVFFAWDGVIDQMEGFILLSIVPLYILHLLKFQNEIRDSLYDVRNYLIHFYNFKRLIKPGTDQKTLEKDLKKEEYEDFVGKGFDVEGFRRIKPRLSALKRSLIKDSLIMVISGSMIYLSANFLVPNAIEIARYFGITENIIAATIVAIGTSLPELSVSISSLRKGFGNLLLGNIIGSNIFNIVLVGGTVAIISPITILPSTLYFSLPFTLLMTALLFIFVRTNWKITKYEGLVLFSLYILFLFLLLTSTL